MTEPATGLTRRWFRRSASPSGCAVPVGLPAKPVVPKGLMTMLLSALRHAGLDMPHVSHRGTLIYITEYNPMTV